MKFSLFNLHLAAVAILFNLNPSAHAEQPSIVADRCLVNALGLKNCSLVIAQKIDQSAPVVTTEDPDLVITVTGTRTSRSLQDSPSTITVTTDRDIRNNVIQNIEDVVRYEPGVSVDNRPARVGNGSFNIRGLDRNRVLILVDGIRIPDIYNNNTSRDLVDFDTIKRLEIVRGPASTLYGSDALGGLVSYTTKSPQDYLQGRDNALETKLTYNSVDRSFSPSATLASQKNQWSSAFTYTRRDGSETSNNSSLAANPQSVAGNNGLLKLQYQINPYSDLALTGEIFNRRTTTQVNSLLGVIPGGPGQVVTRTRQTANDTADRQRVSLGYTFDNPAAGFAQKVQSNVYYQGANTHEEVEDFRTVTGTGASNRRRFAINDFRQNILGGNIQLESNFNTNSWRHRLAYGLELTSTDTSRPRDNTEFNLTTNTINKNVAGELFPNKTFPDTQTTRFGAYIQDEITIGKLALIPGIRFDTYGLSPNANDPAFVRIGGRVQDVRPINASAISPRLGLVYKVSPDVSLTAQYSRGFRSPPYDDAAIAFTNFAFGYTVIPNADLQPETSDGFEIGLRTNSPNFSSSISGYYNKYDNFIDTVAIGTAVIQGRDFSQFQSQNIRDAEISGIEAKSEYWFNNRSDGFSLLGLIAFAQGTNNQTNQPLDSIDPLKAVVGLRYRAPVDRWGVELVTSLVAGKTNVANSTLQPGQATLQPGQTPFSPGGYTTLDLLGYYNFDSATKLNVGVFNLTNAQYFRSSDTRGLLSTDRNLALFTQPGISVGASISHKF